jgi:hypothetical protein
MIVEHIRHITRGAGAFFSPNHIRQNWHHKPRRRSSGRSRPRSRSNGCLAGDVCVLTAEGYRPIASLKVGDQILSLSNVNGGLIARRIRTVISCAPQVVYTIATADASFKATRGHSFLTLRGWVRTQALRGDDLLFGERGTSQKIVSITRSSSLENVYNLRTEAEHNFIIKGGFVAHNYSFLRRFRTWIDELIHFLTKPIGLNGRRVSDELQSELRTL